MTTVEQRDSMLEKLDLVPALFCRAMMREYLLYSNGLLFGGIYDNRLLIKRTQAGEKHGLPLEIPYPGAKPMYRIIDFSDHALTAAIIAQTCTLLPQKK